MKIRTNTPGLRTLNRNSKTVKSLKKNLEKLSSGLRINNAADDAAGLAVSERMRGNITETDRCQDNVQEGVELARIADGALSEINDMLCRAKGLCLQAANGTYDEQERASISQELNSLFEEINRISESSYYNSIQLFRSRVETPPPPPPEQTYYYEIVEDVQHLEPGQLQLWGGMEFINPGSFERAPEPQAATAEFQLDSVVQLDDVNTLDGTSVKIGKNTYYFTKNKNLSPGYDGTPSDSDYYNEFKIDLTRYGTVEDALKALTMAPEVDSVSLDPDTRTVTMTAVCGDLRSQIEADGRVDTIITPGGNGEISNGVVMQNPSGGAPIQQVDGSSVQNNTPKYSGTLTVSYSLSRLNNKTLTATDITNAAGNSLYIYTSGGSKSVSLNGLFTEGMTQEQVANALIAKINGETIGKYTCSASFDSTKGALDITLQGGPETAVSAYVTENTKYVSGSYDYGTAWTASALPISTSSAGNESGTEITITVPSASNVPFGFKLGSQYYLYYDKTKNQLTDATHTLTQYSTSMPKTYNINDIGDVQKHINDLVLSYAKSLPQSDIKSITQNGNQVKIQTYFGGSVNVQASGASITVTPYSYTPGTGGTSPVLNGSTNYFQQDVAVSFDLGGSPSALAGKGFSVGGNKIEFTNGKGLSSDYRDVDVSGFTTLEQVRQAVENLLPSTYKVGLSGSAMTITQKRSASSSSSIKVTDGELGIVDGGSVTFSGGVNAGHSHKELDFSSINKDNLNDLLGKGFRINCATCSGEYINVMFCWTNDGSIPKTFEREDPETKQMRTIHNIPVELSKVKSGDKIVESIVEQVRPSLKHYTDVDIGDPPTTLIAMDKRIGDVVNNGQLYLGRVQTGVETNFVYTYEVKAIPDPMDPPEEPVRATDVKIFTGSNAKEPYIYIRLPHIDSETLKLYAGEVDLTEQDPLELMERVDKANLKISSARGAIGADYNRLEHAFQALGQEKVQLTEAESRIRDADMAALMMENVKLQILTQSQHSMLAQANQLPQQALQLLQ